ncbi:hypothetical protein [Tepidibacter hydrothermalis]|uniref:Deacetylase PdaC domain-containing protein n=1 Tax=Tepidibacter hydrothermalis TaxID=3036126 RepID=A0ABY8ECK9_9FIRM|nr:hypothetical protein [Tepidibacter hydrothermalis]WFD10671.1 hypothetical protein P4S50_00955 [Tepidibacter hydrothermalis]
MKKIYIGILIIIFMNIISNNNIIAKDYIEDEFKYKNIIYNKSSNIDNKTKYNKELEKIRNSKEGSKDYIYRWIEYTYEIKNKKSREVEHKVDMKVLAKLYSKGSFKNIVEVYDATLKYEIYSKRKYEYTSSITYAHPSFYKDAVVFISSGVLRGEEDARKIHFNRTKYIDNRK